MISCGDSFTVVGTKRNSLYAWGTHKRAHSWAKRRSSQTQESFLVWDVKVVEMSTSNVECESPTKSRKIIHNGLGELALLLHMIIIIIKSIIMIDS